MHQSLDFARRPGGAVVAANGGTELDSALSKITAFLRLDASTPVAGEYSSVVDTLNSNPAAQTSANRKPATATSETGQPMAEFDGSDMWLWPLATQNNGTAVWELMFWFNPASFAAGQAFHYVTGAGLSGQASANRHRINVFSSGKVNWDIFVSGTNGRSYTATIATLVPSTLSFLRFAFNSSRTNEADTDGATADAKVRIFLDGSPIALTAANIGTGGTVSALLSATGSAIIGASNDSDTPTVPILNGGQIGPFLAIASTSLSEAEGRAMMGFMRPKA